jgi:hypothetical protein
VQFSESVQRLAYIPIGVVNLFERTLDSFDRILCEINQHRRSVGFEQFCQRLGNLVDVRGEASGGAPIDKTVNVRSALDGVAERPVNVARAASAFGLEP